MIDGRHIQICANQNVYRLVAAYFQSHYLVLARSLSPKSNIESLLGAEY